MLCSYNALNDFSNLLIFFPLSCCLLLFTSILVHFIVLQCNDVLLEFQVLNEKI